MNQSIKPLIIFEMANNHSGNVEHGKKIISEIKKVCEFTCFEYAFKFQYRDIDTFIHKDYANRLDIKNIKRFTETRLSKSDFLELKKYAESLGFTTLCTPFDEISVERIVEECFSYIKIASCSFTDWPLLEKISQYDLPIIASTAGANTEEILNVVNFFLNRKKNISIMHCVAEYPTKTENLQLNQIDYLKKLFPDLRIGYSTHESPDNFFSVQIAVAKGASIFEKHVGVPTDSISLNSYSANPEQIKKWLASIIEAYEACGIIEKRIERTEKETNDLHALQRGVFAKTTIRPGECITKENCYYAIPSLDNQLIANDMSKYNQIKANQVIEPDEPLIKSNITITNTRSLLEAIYNKEVELLDKSNIALAPDSTMEISHHYGIENFYEIGTCIISVINREYCKKIIVQLPNQTNPSHYHIKKEETFQVLYGDIELELDGKKRLCKPGDVITVERGVKHSFSSKNGGIFEEISSTHYIDDSFYLDDRITSNKSRKTIINHYNK